MFVDERGAEANDLATPPDAASDARAPVDVAPLATNDLFGTGPFASGTFTGENGYTAAGSATFYRDSDGVIELRLSDDFAISTMLGPDVVVVLSARPHVPAIDPATDINLGALQQVSDRQTYLLPGSDGGRRSVFVFDQKQSLECAVASLAP